MTLFSSIVGQDKPIGSWTDALEASLKGSLSSEDYSAWECQPSGLQGGGSTLSNSIYPGCPTINPSSGINSAASSGFIAMGWGASLSDSTAVGSYGTDLSFWSLGRDALLLERPTSFPRDTLRNSYRSSLVSLAAEGRPTWACRGLSSWVSHLQEYHLYQPKKVIISKREILTAREEFYHGIALGCRRAWQQWTSKSSSSC